MDGYAYYGDTFISHPTSSDSPLKWKHVLTRGFPSYRAQAQLISDPSTGKTFLFGGYTGRGLSPSGSSNIIGTFGDIWQLCIDEPGGFFESVDFDEESRTARPGPWVRCFTCASVGPFVKKCGGELLVYFFFLIGLKHGPDFVRDMPRTSLLLRFGMPDSWLERTQKNERLSQTIINFPIVSHESGRPITAFQQNPSDGRQLSNPILYPP